MNNYWYYLKNRLKEAWETLSISLLFLWLYWWFKPLRSPSIPSLLLAILVGMIIGAFLEYLLDIFYYKK